ncbi:MAG: cytochrome-c peroxidase [Thiolinea sp.]
MMKNCYFICLFSLCVACTETDTATLSTPKQDTPEKNQAANIDNQLRKLIRQYGLTGDPAKNIKTPAINSAKAQLGKKLFFSRALSGDLNVACASCHHPLLGGGDNLSLSIGVNSRDSHTLGIGRRHKGSLQPDIARNAPTTFNIALWRTHLFHDGRVQKVSDGGITTPDVPYPQSDPLAGSDLVQAQARFPLTSNSEMRGQTFDSKGSTQSCREKLAERLGGYGSQTKQFSSTATLHWLNEFRKAFNAPDGLPNTLITEQNISAALSAYQRSMVFTDNRWKSYIEGNNTAISNTAKKGALLFYRQKNQQGSGCVNCHSGDFFSNEQFYHTLIPPVGPGKVDHNGRLISNRDPGRSLVTGESNDRFKFRVPSLLNVEVTGPWGHNGAYTTLAGIVRHMINPYESALNYDPQQLLQSSVQTTKMRKNIGEMLACDVDITGKTYTENEVQALVAFLLTLTDPCVKERDCLSPWIADSNDMDPMKLLLIGRDEKGKKL